MLDPADREHNDKLDEWLAFAQLAKKQEPCLGFWPSSQSKTESP